MYIDYTTFWMQKHGNSEEEYEDAFSPHQWDGENLPEFLCAVADGATEASFSRLWAQILVDGFVGKQLRRLDATSVGTLAEQWRAAVDDKTRAKPLPWYAEKKLESGAYSSLLGLHLRDNGRWSAVSIGDSCMFQIRPLCWVRAFPFAKAEQFNNHPALISTHGDDLETALVTRRRGLWEEGDTFLLMTDALAHFFIAYPPFRRRFADPTLDQAAFSALVEGLRREKLCRNDDVTLVRICPTLGAVGSGMA